MAPDATDRLPLTRERIVAAALASIDVHGVDQLSMRKLGQVLKVDPMAVYHHIPNKAALFDAIVEYIWAGVELPARGPGERWQGVLHAAFSALRDRLRQHPRAVVLVGTRPSVTPASLRLIDATLGRLSAAGLPGKDAMQLIDCLSGYTISKVLAETGEALGGASDVVGRALAGVTPQSHPHFAAVLPGYGFAPDEEFDAGLRALIAGWQLR